VNIKPQVDKWFSRRPRVIIPGRGTTLNLGCATDIRVLWMSNLHLPGDGQIELFTRPQDYEPKVYVFPKHLDERWPACTSRRLAYT